MNVTQQTASFLAREVSDGIIAPSYSEKALEILKGKRKGSYLVLKMDPSYVPEEKETKEVFGIMFEQGRNNAVIDESLLKNIPTDNKTIPDAAKRDLLISLITLKYTSVQFRLLRQRRAGHRHRCGTAVENSLYSSCGQ